MNIDWSQVLSAVLTVVLPPVILWVTTAIVGLIRGLGDLIKGTQIDNVALQVVASVAQELGDDMKKKAADGKLTEDERQALKNLAIDRLSVGLRSIGVQITVELKEYLGVLVENAYAKLRNSRSFLGNLKAPTLPLGNPSNLLK